MNPADYTDMGGTGEVFLSTHWSLLGGDADLVNENKNNALIGLLLKKYWKPVYCYLRRKGYDNERAKDLTQGFFYEVVLGRGLIDKVDRSKGRFRSFLLIALNRYLINIREQERAQKRIPRDRLIPLEIVDTIKLPHFITESAPEDSFNYTWVSQMLEQVLKQVEAECAREGKNTHWNVFQDRVLQPIMKGIAPPSLKEICNTYKIKDDAKASNMIVTVKRRFQAALMKSLRESVLTDEQVDDELADLKRFFPKMAQDDK